MKELNMSEAQTVTGGSAPGGIFIALEEWLPDASPSSPWMPIIVNDLVDREIPDWALPYM